MRHKKEDEQFSNLTNDEKKEKRFYRRTTLVMIMVSVVLVVAIIVNFATTIVSKKQERERLASFKRAEVPANVSVQTITNGRYTETISLNASLKNLAGIVNEMAPVRGKVKVNNVRPGDKVKIDDVLGYVDASDIGERYEPAPVYSHVDGIVSKVIGVPGEQVTNASPLFEIVPNGEFVLEGVVSEKDIGGLKVGDNATFTTVANPNIVHPARLRFVSPVVDDTSRTVALEFELEDDENADLLRQGMLVSVDIESAVQDDVLMVQNSAIGNYLTNKIVYVVDSDNVAHQTNVSIDRSNGKSSIVSGGLSVGDKVVVAGTVRDGQTVNILN